MKATDLPLAGIRIIDFSRVIAGPVCTAMLADMGAEVIKIEDVQGGDESRQWSPQIEGYSPAYLANNRNKKSIAVSLKHEAGQKIVRQLLVDADVLVENFSTGMMQKFGLDYPTLAPVYPRLIYASIAAFGRRGPRASQSGYEALMQAFSGIMSITGESGGAPVRCGISAVDILTGNVTAFAITSAILLRQRTGKGQYVEGSLFSSAIALLNFQAQNHLLCQSQPKPMGSAHPSLVPYKNFRCRDARWLFVAAGNDRLWRRLAQAIGMPEWAIDTKFATNTERVRNRELLERLLDEHFATVDSAEMLERLQRHEVPVTPVHSVAEALADPQAEFTPTIRPTVHPTLGRMGIVGLPLEFSGLSELPNRPAPCHGQHTEEVARACGLSGRDIDQLVESGVLSCATRSGRSAARGDP